jgi:hypothetical protein
MKLAVRAGVLLAMVSLLSASANAWACSVCGCGDPLLTAKDPAAIASRFRLQMDMEYLRIGAGTEGQPGFTGQPTTWLPVQRRVPAARRPLP